MEIEDEEVLVFVKKNKNLRDKFYIGNKEKFQKRLKTYTIDIK